MCKFCNLKLYKQMESIKESIQESVRCKDWPEEVKEYYRWMNGINDEGWKWHIDDNGNVILEMFNQGGYDSIVLECKFCPHCGRKLDAEELNGKE